jgi:hypothetical protein
VNSEYLQREVESFFSLARFALVFSDERRGEASRF